MFKIHINIINDSIYIYKKKERLKNVKPKNS